MAKSLAEDNVGRDHDAFIKMMRSPGRRRPQMIENQSRQIALESKVNQHENYSSSKPSKEDAASSGKEVVTDLRSHSSQKDKGDQTKNDLRCTSGWCGSPSLAYLFCIIAYCCPTARDLN